MLEEEEEPPKTIFVALKAPRRGSEKKRRASQSKFDYMQAPPSLASTLQPIFPWEEAEDITERTSTSSFSTSSTSTSQHTNNNNRRRTNPDLLHQHLLLFVLFVTVALAAGSLLDGDANSSKRPKKMGKQRGQDLPAASSKQEGIAKDMYQVYEKMKLDYHSKTFPNETTSNNPHLEWKVLNERDGAKVSLMQHASDPTCPYVKMETIIPTSVEACWEFLGIHNWHWSMPKMDPFYESHKVYSNYTHKDVNMILVQKKTHRILAFGKRDFVFLSVSDQPLQDGTYVSGSVSVETPDVPRSPQYTRAFQDSIAFYKPVQQEDGEEHCHLTIVCRIDLNDSGEHGSRGYVPMWLYVKTVGATGIKSVLKMKDALVEMKREQQQAAQVDEEEEAETSSLLSGQAPTAAFAPPITTPPTPAMQQEMPAPVNPIHTIKQVGKVNQQTQQQQQASTFTFWQRPRGGAFVVKAQPSKPKQQQLQASPVVEKWKPLYQVFTHIPPKQGPEPRTSNQGGWGLGAKWLQQVPLVGASGHKDTKTDPRNPESDRFG